MRLDAKIAIVTGGSSGFGEGIAKRFAEEGCKVMIADLNDADGEKVASDIVKTGGIARYVHTDVTSDDDWMALVQATLDAFGGLTTVVNNAGAAHANAPVAEIPEEDFDRVYAVNVKSLFHSARHCVPILQQNGDGAFINIASTSAIRPRPGMTWYSASKGSMVTASRSMAVELATDKIRVCVINPVAAATPLLRNFIGNDNNEEALAKLGESIPLGRLALPADVANTALWLASDEAEFITGTCIEVDGGRCV